MKRPMILYFATENWHFSRQLQIHFGKVRNAMKNANFTARAG